MPKPLRVLIIEDSPPDVELCLHELRRSGFDPDFQVVQTPEDLARALAENHWDIVLSDYTMPRFNAIEALAGVRRQDREVPFIVVTGTLDEETAVDCLKQGADNYVLKENLPRLGPAVQQALKFRDEQRQRRLLESQLREAQKMEALGQLAAGVAHDFNNLITAILGYAEVAQRTLDAHSEAAPALDGIKQACAGAAGVTRSLLTFSRRGDAARAPLHLGRHVQESLRLIRHMLPASVELKAEVSTTDPLWVVADANQIQQVLLNIVLNARDVMLGGGRLTISVQAEDVRQGDVFSAVATAGLGNVAVAIEDTGTGIPEDVIEHIFEPFFTTKPRGQGTGLGLSIVHGIVTEHGGTVDVQSKVGRGTRIVVRLPRIAAPRREEEETAQRAAHAGHGELILLIEDHRQVRAIMAESLTDAGYRVLQASDGFEGLRVFQEATVPVNLVVLDVDLPRMDGRECLRRIRHLRPGQPALMISGLADGSSVSGAGAELLRKPFTMNEFLAAVYRRCKTATVREGTGHESDPSGCRR